MQSTATPAMLPPAGSNPVGHRVGAPDFHEFLAADFERIGRRVIERCQGVDGRRLYLSGATGFFGKNLLSLFAHLRSRGASFRVTALSRDPARFALLNPWVRNFDWLDWVKGDVAEDWPGDGRYDYVLHAATETAAAAHLRKLDLFENILAGTRRALEFAQARGVSRVLLCGSGAQYGPMPAHAAGGVSESTLLACDCTQIGSAYGEAKRASEMLAMLHAQGGGFEVVNTRGFAFVGPGLPLDGHFAIGNFIADALEGRPIQLATAGEAVRSYLYGADLAVWLTVLLLESEHGRAVNIGSDEALRLIDLATRVRDAVAPRLPVRAGQAAQPGERRFYAPSIGYARSLGLDVWTDLDAAIARTAAWHRRAPAQHVSNFPKESVQ
jgi:nucleoside-diphosphate-sugar epimerase